MARQMLAVVGILIVAAACSGNLTEPTTTASSSMVTTVTTSTVATAVSFEVPRLGSTLEEPFPLPIEVVEDAVLHVDESCVTAETAGKTILLLIHLHEVWVQGPAMHFEDLDPTTPTLVLSSGARYQLRGIPDPFDVELAEPMPPDCAYDERLVLLGALDLPVGHGLTTRPVTVDEAVATIGINSTTITINGACTTVTSPDDRELLVIWPAGTVSLLDDHTIHMSRWEAIFTEAVVRSGDAVGLFGAISDISPEDPPRGCEYDGTFFAEVIRPVSGFEVAP